MRRLGVFLVAALMAAGCSALAGGWQYTLVGPASLLVECPPCALPSYSQALFGSFTLTRQSSNSTEQVFRLEDLRLYAGAAGNPEFLLTGNGTWRITNGAGQSLALTTLATRAGSYTNTPLDFTNNQPGISQDLPLLAAELTDARGNAFEVWHLGLFAVPAREIWFSTAHSFTGADGRTGTGGDWLSASGRFVRREADFLQNLGLMPGLGGNVDAVTVNTNGEILFSLGQDVFSEAKGMTFHDGDLLTIRGGVFRKNEQLAAAFGFMPPVADLGLDAAAMQPDGLILFSIKTEVFSQALGKTLRRGDLLTSQGAIFRTQEQLLARFQPTTASDFGLDAVFLWPHGEIWFSTETGFQDKNLGGILPGDLLSDRGYVVRRNLSLMAPFSPLEDLADFGLDSLLVVTDAMAPLAAPRITGYQWRPSSGVLELDWQGGGRVFQVEWAPSASGPWLPGTELEAASQAAFSFSSNTPPARFFRLRQW